MFLSFLVQPVLAKTNILHLYTIQRVCLDVMATRNYDCGVLSRSVAGTHDAFRRPLGHITSSVYEKNVA